MNTLTTRVLVDQLQQAGFKLSLAPAGGLAVAPACQLTDDLRALIRNGKDQLVDWLIAANDAGIHALDPADNALDWKDLAAAYHAHHFNCPICIAAGRGAYYGQRCGVGAALWSAYAD